jgi:antitoxin component YwqK of YwqJK toxin-antitoxin module
MKFLSNMTNRIFSIIFIFTSGFSFSQKINPVYFDKKWETTSKENASFYRIMPEKKLADLILIEDFYINKTPQFQGYSLQKDLDSYVGDIVWYDKNGFDSSFYQYYNSSDVPVLVYYHPNGEKRKSVSYKNGIKNGETIIYSQDGTVLMKGIYIKGKPKSGDFEVLKYGNEYRYNKRDLKLQREEEERGTAAIVNDDSFIDVAIDKNKLAKTINKKIFWLGSKQLAQVTVCDVTSYNLKPLQQITYDRSGKILQTLTKKDFEDYGVEIKDGVQYDYYLQNYFAVALKMKTHYINGKKSGEELSYFPNGKLAKKSHYINDRKDGDEVEYAENGNVVFQRTFKKGVPFSGNFDEDFERNITINTNYSNGLKEGEAVAKTQKDSVVARGIYKNDKPFKGSFIIKIDEERNELINIENYKRTGLQTVFGYGLHDISKTYMCVDDKANGLATFYKDNKVTGELVYKNDKPFNGYLIESDEYVIYKDGYISQLVKYRDNSKMEDSDILMIKSYADDKLSKIVYNFFRIDGVFQDSYEGIYKDGKPFSGYFLTENRNFNYVNYFEEGKIKFQYSNDYLKEKENYSDSFYDIKSTYKDGKIVDGIEYTILDNQMISKYLKNGILQSFFYDFSVAYYANRFHFEMKNDAIEIRMFRNNKLAKIVIDNTAGKETKQLILDDKVLLSYSTFDYESAISFPKKTQSIYYSQSNNRIVAKKVNFGQVGDERGDGDDWKLLTAFFGIVNNKSGNALEVFNKLGEDLSLGRGAEMVAHIDTSSENIGIASIDLNQEGKPEMGIAIQKTKNNYTLKTYFNEKIITEKNNISFGDLKTECEKMYEILSDRMNNRSK